MQTFSYEQIIARCSSVLGHQRFEILQNHWTSVRKASKSIVYDRVKSNTIADYQRAAQMLSPTPYPSTSPHLRKLEILQRQAESLGLEEDFYLAPQTTFFHNGLNNAGVEMSASMGSGQDCTGINDGSKNTVLVTYLADAWNWGAEIFCECEVRYVKKHEPGGGYTVHFIWNGGGRESFKDEQNNNLMWIRAKELCILGAGALGKEVFEGILEWLVLTSKSVHQEQHQYCFALRNAGWRCLP